MKKILIIILVFMMVLTACTTKDALETDTEKGPEKTSEKTPEKEMSEFTTIYAPEIQTVNYLKSTVTDNVQLAYLTVDGLVEFDQYGILIPSAATDWTISEDALTYTFKLREGVNWYTHTGEPYAEVTAEDFVTGLKWVLTKENTSSMANTVYNVIKNAKGYYDGEITDFSQVGVKAIDKYTLEYTLIQPTPYFLRQTSFPCFYPLNAKFLEETGELFGTGHDTLLYSGAYLLTNFDPENTRVLQYNKNYWNKDIISIGRIIYKYNKEANVIGQEMYLRKDIDYVVIPGTILDEWMNDNVKKDLMHPDFPTNMTYFMGLNFEPNYEDEYKPQDWKTAVNNKNFRKSIFHGLDRLSAASVTNPYDPERVITNTLTRSDFVQADGTDYTMMEPLKKFTETESFNKDLALEYKAKAMEELKGKVEFPIKVVFPYTVDSVDITNRAQIIEQQMEKLLGTDYIDIVLVGYPSTGFNNDVRNPGLFSMLIIGWGPDYVDPIGSMDFMLASAHSSKAGRIHLAEEYIEANGNGKFENMIIEANKIVNNKKERYEAFAEAEAFLLEEAFIVPLMRSGGGFIASYLDPFTRYRSQMGLGSMAKFKGAVVLDKPLGIEGYKKAEKEFMIKLQEARKNSKYE